MKLSRPEVDKALCDQVKAANPETKGFSQRCLVEWALRKALLKGEAQQ